MQYTAPPQPRGGGRRPEGFEYSKFKFIISNIGLNSNLKKSTQAYGYCIALNIIIFLLKIISAAHFFVGSKFVRRSRTIRTLLRKNYFCCAFLRWSSFWFSYVALLRAFTKISLRLELLCINNFKTFFTWKLLQKNRKIISFRETEF